MLLAVVLDVELMRGASESTTTTDVEVESEDMMVTSGTAREWPGSFTSRKLSPTPHLEHLLAPTSLQLAHSGD